jgi:hypothetical protein
MSVGLVADLPRQRSLDGLDQSPRTTKSRIIETRGRRQERARDRSARVREPSGTAPDRELGRDLVGFGARGWSGEREGSGHLITVGRHQELVAVLYADFGLSPTFSCAIARPVSRGEGPTYPDSPAASRAASRSVNACRFRTLP